MTVCREIKTFSRTHEHVADFFSLLAVALLFGSIWAFLAYYAQIMDWLYANPPLHGSILVAALVVDVLVVLGLLAVGSARFGGDDERCFGTFRGRRNSASPLSAFGIWLRHLENVGKKHR